MRKRALLVLENGQTFEGESFGATGETFGEVVFNTSMTGYQEILTDPSYAGQIVTMTYPHIGNYGVNFEDLESAKPQVAGFIVREASRVFSNWRAQGSLEDYLVEHKVVGIHGIDTRALTKLIRTFGAMKGSISTEDLDSQSLLERVKASPSIVGRDLVKEVTTSQAYWWEEKKSGQYRVAVLDGGAKRNILRELSQRQCALYVMPAHSSPEEIEKINPDGIFVSNGPGDPAGAPYLFETLTHFLDKKPVFGICLGHQILSLALGGKTFKLKFGHRGANQPIKNLKSGRVEITSENHGFAVDPASLSIEMKLWKVGSSIKAGESWRGKSQWGEVELTHLNLNDGTVEGIKCFDIPAFSVQFHPEASPGPHDTKYLFDQFINLMEQYR